MRNLSIFLILCLCGGWVFASDCFDVEVDLNFGYRQDSLRFIDSYNTQSVPGGNTLITAGDDQRWNSLNIADLQGCFSCAYKGFYVRGEGDYGWILGGSNPAIDYQTLVGGGLTSVLSTSTKGKTRGDVWDLLGGGGYRFYWNSGRSFIAPVAGYSLHKQNTRQSNISGISSQDIVSVASFTYEDQGYRNVSFEWFGPWVGLDFQYSPFCKFRIFGTYEYHWGESNLFGKAKISLVETSLENQANVTAYRTFHHNGAWGNKGSLGFSYAVAANWLVGLVGNYSYWSVNRGSSVNKNESLSINPDPIIGVGQIVRTNWQSWNILATLKFNFPCKRAP